MIGFDNKFRWNIYKILDGDLPILSCLAIWEMFPENWCEVGADKTIKAWDSCKSSGTEPDRSPHFKTSH